MPYIKKHEQGVFKSMMANVDVANMTASALFKFASKSAGHFNFVVTKLIMYRLKRQGMSYANLRMILGDLEAIKTEFYRRVVADYENKKLEENGDVYEEFTL